MKRTAIIAVLLLSISTRAEAQADRVLVIGPSDSPAIGRLLAELRAMGLHPARVQRDQPLSPDEIEVLARERDVGSAISISSSAVGARVWLVDRITGKALFREVPAAGEDDAAIVALCAVELLRASLLEVHAAHPPRGEVESSALVETIARPSVDSGPVGLEVGVTVTGTPGGADPAAQIRAAFSVRLDRWVGIAAFAHLPVHAVVVSGDEGAADLWFGTVGLTARVLLLAPSESIQPYVGLGGAASLLSVSGRPTSPYVARSGRIYDGGPVFEAGARWAITPLVGLRLDLAAVVFVSNAVIYFNGRPVVAMGQPLLSGSIGFDLTL